MAALTLAAGLAPGLAGPARADETLVVRKIQVQLLIAGLSPKGCTVDIKPGHAGCKFAPVVDRPIKPDGKLSVQLNDVEILSADRDCSLAITIKEDGQADRTARRGFRVPAPVPGAVPSVTCYLNSPSKLARAEAERTRR